MHWRRVGERRNAHRLAGSGDVLTIEEGAGPIFDRLHVGDLWIPVTLTAVETNTAAGGQDAGRKGLPATSEAIFEGFYCG